MNRSVVIVPVERATDVARVVRVATAIAASPVDVHLVQVMTADGLWAMEQEGRGPAAWSPGTRSAPAREGAAIRTVRVRGKAEAIIPAYAQLVGARAIIVERDYGTPRIWRSAAVVRRLSRSSPVPVLVLPAQGPALDRVARGDISRVVVAVDSSVGSAVALRTGVALARRHDARLTMLHAIKNVPEHMVFSGSEAWRVMQRLPAQERQMAGQLRQRAALLGDTNAQAQVVTGDPAQPSSAPLPRQILTLWSWELRRGPRSISGSLAPRSAPYCAARGRLFLSFQSSEAQNSGTSSVRWRSAKRRQPSPTNQPDTERV